MFSKTRSDGIDSQLSFNVKIKKKKNFNVIYHVINLLNNCEGVTSKQEFKPK